MDIRKILSNRKAIIFSLMSVLFAILFITVFSQNFHSSPEDSIPGSNIRIKVLDTFTRNFENYVGDSIRVSTYMTLESMTKYRALNGGFFADQNSFNQAFSNCMICGTYNCAPGPSCTGNPSYDLNTSIATIANLASIDMNINTQYKINSVSVTQTYPFEVEVSVDISYNVTDNSGNYYARWSKNSVINQSVSIIGLRDPLGYINSSGNYNNPITMYTGDCQFSGGCWNIANVTVFYKQDSYRYYSNGTNFLERYWQGIASSSCCGIENILHPNQLSSPLNINNTFVDNYYWSNQYRCHNTNGTKMLNITIAGDTISMDEITAGRYGIASNGTVICQ